MGVKAVDDVVRSLREAIGYLREGKLDSETIRLRRRDVDAVLYTLNKAGNDLEFMSTSLSRRGYGDASLLGRLKQAFNGLFGGF